MPPIDRREFVKLMGLTAVPALISCEADTPPEAQPAAATAAKPAAKPAPATSASGAPAGFYDVPMKGSARLLHITDVHGQLNPVYFREPNVNLGVGDAYGRPPHIVGKKLLKEMGLNENTAESYAYTYLDFDNAAKKYGRTGGFANMKTLLDKLRQQAGGRQNTLTIDGGDLWQGSGTALWLSLIHISEPTRQLASSRMPSSA